MQHIFKVIIWTQKGLNQGHHNVLSPSMGYMLVNAQMKSIWISVQLNIFKTCASREK
jgi:hypothetical protein